jgi:hypothetical protein
MHERISMQKEATAAMHLIFRVSRQWQDIRSMREGVDWCPDIVKAARQRADIVKVRHVWIVLAFWILSAVAASIPDANQIAVRIAEAPGELFVGPHRF